MGHATRHAAGETVTTSAPRTRHHSSRSLPPRLPSRDLDFDGFAATLLRDLDPRSTLERVLVDRLILSAWRLHLTSLAEMDAARGGDDLAPTSRPTRRAEQSFETALDLLGSARCAARGRWGTPAPTASKPVDPHRPSDDPIHDPEEGPLSNEWPVLPDARTRPADEFVDEQEDDDVPVRWQERLAFDPNVSDSSPVVKGTWVTAGHVVSLIVDGWTWADVLRAHPELCEDDIRTCLAYTVEQDNSGEF